MNSKERKTYRGIRKMMAKENAKWPDIPIKVQKDHWPPRESLKNYPLNVWRSKNWLIQEYKENDHIRLSVNRTTIAPDGKWDEGISWEDLQWIKEQIGYGDRWAVEIYPPRTKSINVANMRHLWILNDPPSYGWNI